MGLNTHINFYVLGSIAGLSSRAPSRAKESLTRLGGRISGSATETAKDVPGLPIATIQPLPVSRRVPYKILRRVQYYISSFAGTTTKLAPTSRQSCTR